MAGTPDSGTRGDTPNAESDHPSCWVKRYSAKHSLRRVTDFPAGILPPKKVRIYRRRDHHLLQWWDPREGCTLNERVDGDLVEALSHAREIDHRIEHFKSSGRKVRQTGHRELVSEYVADLNRRANAGEIDVATVGRYEAALRRHYLTYVEQPRVVRKYGHVSKLDRTFQLEFTAYLNNVRVSSNGHANTRPRPLKSQGFVLDVVRSMLQWAADADRGNLLPDGFRNPFVLRKKNSNHVVVDPISSPDITVGMAVDFAMAADSFQLAIFAPLLLYGLRPGELGWLFRENVDDDWLRVACITELDYTTKGRRDKRFPMVDCLKIRWNTSGDRSGLLFAKRRVAEGRVSVPLLGQSLTALVDEYRCRCTAAQSDSAAKKRQLRNRLMKYAGQLDYDHVEGEFRKLASQLKWPASATLKDLRHLFSTCLENAGVPEFYRRYFMGQSFGKAPIVAYTHLTGDKLRQHYEKALETELAPLLDAVVSRSRELDALATKDMDNAQN